MKGLNRRLNKYRTKWRGHVDNIIPERRLSHQANNISQLLRCVQEDRGITQISYEDTTGSYAWECIKYKIKNSN